MRRLCITPGCGGTTRAGGRCLECARQYEATIDRAGSKLYGTKGWGLTRRQQLFRQSLCELRHPGCNGLASEVHHRVALRDGGAKYAPSNLMSTCKSCHAVETRREMLKRRGLR
jgi:5-methylcytosine-specific restriction endonuclease McrA